MPTLSVQHMPNGFEIETPSFWYWMKAGIAFTLGAGAVWLTSVMAWIWLISQAPGLVMLKTLLR